MKLVYLFFFGPFLHSIIFISPASLSLLFDTFHGWNVNIREIGTLRFNFLHGNEKFNDYEKFVCWVFLQFNLI